jgi:hypothetical protein
MMFCYVCVQDYEDVENLSTEQRRCYGLLCKFLQELLIRLQQYKNDLQVACLETIIAAPVALVVPLLPHAAPAFEVYYQFSFCSFLLVIYVKL